jgi:hypothetical protein
MKYQLDDVESLSRGKRSRAKIGSRATPHHLRPHERAQFEAAKRVGFLKLRRKDRVNIKNIYEKWCCAQGTLAVILDARNEQSPTVTISTPQLNDGTLLAPQHVQQFHTVKENLISDYPKWRGFTQELPTEARLTPPSEIPPRAFALQVSCVLKSIV